LGQSYLSAVELGKVDARLSTLQDIARALQAEVTLVPNESAESIGAIWGHEKPAHERRLFEIEPD
jgi:hypothetical protein